MTGIDGVEPRGRKERARKVASELQTPKMLTRSLPAHSPSPLGFCNPCRSTPVGSIETRSLPTLTRSYPRRFTFYVAPPSCSIREQAGYSCAESVCSLFEKTMRINNRLGGFSSRQTIEQFHQARLVRITHGRFAIRLDPFRVLNPKFVVNLLPELRVSVDLMMQRRWLGERFMCGVGWFA